MLSRINVLLIGVLALSYVIFFFIFMPITLPLEQPGWWNNVLGETRFSAILWAQLVHSLGMMMAAVPAALIIVRVFPFSKYWAATAVAAGLNLVLCYDLLRSYTMFGLPDSKAIQISHLIDMLKVIPIMFITVFMLAIVLHTNELKNVNASKTGANAAQKRL